MGDKFASSATRLAGLSGAILGWRPNEFWAATPIELAAVLDALTPKAEAPPSRDEMCRLQERFPDG